MVGGLRDIVLWSDLREIIHTHAERCILSSYDGASPPGPGMLDSEEDDETPPLTAANPNASEGPFALFSLSSLPPIPCQALYSLLCLSIVDPPSPFPQPPAAPCPSNGRRPWRPSGRTCGGGGGRCSPRTPSSSAWTCQVGVPDRYALKTISHEDKWIHRYDYHGSGRLAASCLLVLLYMH